MNILAWILSGLLAAVYLFAGGSKAFLPYEKTINDPRMGWAKSFSPAQVTGIGAMVVHGRRGEKEALPVTVVLLALAVAVAVAVAVIRFAQL